MKHFYYIITFFIGVILLSTMSNGKINEDSSIIAPVRTEIITPILKKEFREGDMPQRIQGGNPRQESNFLTFDGSMDGNRQVDPQIAVGGGYVFHATNLGLVIYDKKGNYIDGVSQKFFNGGIDPKLFFDPHNKVFCFDLWNPWDKEKKKPINIAVSKTNNPNKAWNIYPIPAPNGVDGGGIGFSKKWIGYSFPGGEENTFVLSMKDAKKGKDVKVFHFKGSLGHPVFTQDKMDDLYFFKLNKEEFVLTKVTDDENGIPVAKIVSKAKHQLNYTDYPPKASQKNTEQVVSSGDRNPKNLVLQNGSIWFSHAVNYKGRSAVQWHQIKLDGTIVQTGLIENENTNYIQTTIAVNKKNDVLIGFQETNANMYISPRLAYRHASDPLGTVRKIVSLGEGKGATDGISWGDYSGSVIDGDNLTDLWTIQSITDEGGKGDTVIVKVPF